MKLNIDRRRFPRFDLEAMYTTIAVRTLENDTFELQGHSYDISEGGIRFELDRGIERGTQIAMMINLPTMNAGDEAHGPDHAVYVFATIVWIEDENEPGPIKMAAVFNRWARQGDRERLIAELGKGVYRRQAA